MHLGCLLASSPETKEHVFPKDLSHLSHQCLLVGRVNSGVAAEWRPGSRAGAGSRSNALQAMTQEMHVSTGNMSNASNGKIRFRHAVNLTSSCTALEDVDRAPAIRKQILYGQRCFRHKLAVQGAECISAEYLPVDARIAVDVGGCGQVL